MSDEVSDFLRSVEALKGRREEEDEARSRELEEKILQEKRERQARRERARSISPQKSSPANTPPPSSQVQQRSSIVQPLEESNAAASSPALESSGSPQPRAAIRSPKAMEHTTDFLASTSPTKENESPFESDSKRGSTTSLNSPSSAIAPSRTPLSWQRRPASQASERSKPRTLSMVAAENAAAKSSPNLTDSTASPTEPAFSREQIAQSLSGKDPAWFRQTVDRGQNSAAYRRDQGEDQDTTDMSALRTQLPGMVRDTGTPTESSKMTSDPRSSSPALLGKLGSPFPLSSAQRLEPPTGDADGAGDREVDAKEQTPAPSDGRISPGRPVSPTKGMGGFVQSAMMKRTDSVKRWSVSSPKGLQRGDPAAFGMDSAVSRTSNALKEGLSLSTPEPGREKEAGGQSEGGEGADSHVDAEKITPPSSPTRTMDPRRWSPTKSSSWLEAALNKPESPKPKVTPIPPNQPAWMVELNKAKAQKANSGSADLGRSASAAPKHEVKTGGLMRSTPMGAGVKPAVLGSGFPGIRTPDKFAPGDFRSNIAAKPSPKETSEDPEVKGDEGRRGSAVSTGEVPTAAKTKPETPPKKDFRGNLKPRAPPPETAAPESTAELKNMVGNLRRAKTQNYKAPDELKDNILRGKAALNATGGPQKSERKDEFKEAILKKKDDFKKAQQEGRGISRTLSNTSEQPIPEGLAKSLAITQPGALKRGSPISSPTIPSPPLESNGSSGFTTPKAIVQRVPPEAAPKPTPESLPRIGKTAVATTLPPQKEANVFNRIQSKASSGGSGGSGSSGGIADRLAGLLARGPPGMASSTSPNSSALNLSGGEAGEPTGPGPQLTHMTKNRARGPRRKAPSSVAKPSEEPEQPQAKPEQQPETKETKPPKPAVAAKPSSSINGGRSFSNPKPAALSMAAEPENAIPDTKKASVDSSSKDQTKEEAKPADPLPVRTRQRSPTKIHEQIAAFAAKDQLASKPAADQDDAVSQPSSPKKLDTKRMSRFMDEAGQPRAETDKPLPPSPNKRRPLPDPFVTSSQKDTPPKDDVADSPKPPPPPPKNGAMFFGGMGASSTTQATSVKPEVTVQTTAASFSSSNTSLPDRSRTPPRGARPMPSSIHVKKDSMQIATPMRSPTKYGFEVSAMLTEFFGPARPRRNYKADAADVLVRRPAAGPIVQTAKAQLYQLSGDGKKQPVRTHYERVLFEREMYLCTHTFVGEGGKKTSEVYFWAGDEVPESTVDDALVFAQREARSSGGKLVRLEQGKETSEFIQALGGIVIVRRGSSNRYDSLAPNMLCGRRYLGQVAFDEVDFSPSSLCSGFPYLIAQDGKCYLWKGKGSDVDELGCARLVGMDLALTGELVEVEDGAEPASFWDDIFGGSSRPQSADHWRLKPNYDRYCGRLFYSNPADKKQIIELSPFNQHDLLPSNIYVLDAFFEMYIIVGARSQHQYAAFHNALDFAQEYSILAAGMEDRPFIPVSTVVLEGVPRDLKSVFRKWHDGASPTVMNPHNPTSPDLRRGRSLRIVPLNQALQALME